MTDELMDLIRLAAGEVATATEWRDDLIRKAVSEGRTLRVIAEAAGVSHQTISRIANRRGTP